MESGVFFESINFAVTKKLPVVFVCENNLYSVYTHLNDRQPKNRKIFKMVSGLGIKSFNFDGSKPFSFVNDLKNILKNVRYKNEPCFIEFSTYRYLEHCGPYKDDDLGYRSKKEQLKWSKKDPYKYLKKVFIKNLNLIKYVNFTEKKNLKIIESAFLYAHKSKFPKQQELMKNVYKKI